MQVDDDRRESGDEHDHDERRETLGHGVTLSDLAPRSRHRDTVADRPGGSSVYDQVDAHRGMRRIGPTKADHSREGTTTMRCAGAR